MLTCGHSYHSFCRKFMRLQLKVIKCNTSKYRGTIKENIQNIQQPGSGISYR